VLTAEAAILKVQALYECLATRRPEVEEFDRYYEGEHPLKYASPEWAEFHKGRYKGFADNWTAVVADASNERLQVTGVRAGSESGERELWADWLRNDMPAQSSQGFLESIIAKRSAVIVWGNSDDEPVSTWEHPAQVYVEYAADNPRKRLYALKAWVDGNREFATLYEADAVWKFERQSPFVIEDGKTKSGLYVSGTAWGSGWEPRQASGDDTWPIANPLGEIPVVEVPNRPRLGREPLSDIAGTMAMQDAINLLWAYLFGAADHASFPARVVMGNEHPKLPVLDKDGKKVGEKPVDLKDLQHGRLLWLTGQNASIGQWDAAKLDVFTDVIEVAIGHIGGQTRTPAHYFVANKGLSNINGETLVATETPLVKKVEEFQLFSSRAMSDIFRLYAKVRGNEALADSLTTSSVQWANPAIRSEAQMADSLLKKKQIGYPLEYLLELDGLPGPDRARILEMARREQTDPFLAMAAMRGLDGDDSGSAVGGE